MEAKEVLNMPWTNVKDWSILSASKEKRNNYFVLEEDVDVFVENLFREVARKLHVSYDELLPILKKENGAFYKLKTSLFWGYEVGYTKNHTQLKELENLLRIPDVSKLDYINSENIMNCLSMYFNLTESERAAFLSAIKAEDSGS